MIQYKTASFQKEAMRTQVTVPLFYEINFVYSGFFVLK